MSDRGTEPWLPTTFTAPTKVVLPDRQHHLRPISADDTDLDMVAVMGSQKRLWSIYGEAWGWPPADMTHEADREDLARHAEDMTRNKSFNFALFPADEQALLGCVYLDPPAREGGAGAEISWWVIDALVGSEVEAMLDTFVPAWIASEWPIANPRFVGRDLTWSEWLALPEL